MDQGSCSSAAMAKNSKLWLSLSSGFNDKSQLHILEMLAEGSWQEDIIIKSGDKIDASSRTNRNGRSSRRSRGVRSQSGPV